MKGTCLRAWLAGGLAAVFMAAVTGNAAAVVIFSDSFESPDVTGNTNTEPTGWIETGSSNAGVNDENSGVFTTPFGSQVAWVNTNAALETTASILSAVLEPNTDYTLSFNVGRRTDLNPPTRPNNYDVQLWAGSTMLGQAAGHTTLTDLSETDGFVVNIGSSHPAHGQALKIVLAGETQPQYDNLELSTGGPAPIPAVGFDMDVGPSAITAPGFASMFFANDTDPTATSTAANPFGGGGSIVASTSSAGVNRDRGTIDALLDEFAGSNDPLLITVSGIPTGLYDVETFHADFTGNLIPFDPDATSDVSLSTDGGTTFGTPMTVNITGGPGAPHSALFQNVAITAGMDLVIQTVGSGNQGTGRINGFTITQVTVIPEPSTILIWSLLAALGLAAGRRRRPE